MKRLFIILLMLLPVQLVAQKTFTTTKCMFSYLKDNGKWSEWSTIQRVVRVDITERPIVISVNDETKNEVLLTKRRGRYKGSSTVDSTPLTGFKWLGVAKTGEAVRVTIDRYETGEQGVMLLYPKWKYYYTNKD